ncbi:peptide chain release factor N(5)-glutamine methyltransferase [Paracoccaceae bacterium GXU_MW_L88]
MTVRDALRMGREALAEIDGGAQDARRLLQGICGRSLFDSDPVSAEDAARYQAALTRRAAREPVSKILGKRLFFKHEFLTGPDVLDPRPETETLVLAALEAPFSRALDLGTGSGAIILSLLAERPDAAGVATDLSENALAMALRNAENLALTDRVTLLQGDWFAPVTGRFDLIVSNPPYITETEMETLAPEVRRFDPHLALTTGGDGLASYRTLAAGLAAHLEPGGRAFFEIGLEQGESASAIFRRAGFAVEILPDLDGRDRVLKVTQP